MNVMAVLLEIDRLSSSFLCGQLRLLGFEVLYYVLTLCCCAAHTIGV